MTTKQTIDFYFDLTSPYSYVAAEQIEDIAAAGNRVVNYKPTLLGFVFKSTGNSAPMMNPAKGKYSAKDFARTARFHGLEINWPKKFPINATVGSRAILQVINTQPEKAGELTRALYKAYFVTGQDITEEAVVAEVASSIGLDGTALVAGTQDESIKEQMKNAVQESIDAGMFGAPYFVVDGEAFWGQDRMEQLRRWVVEGPF
ncbi:2-hydroxychromene-2-carboxylate isomerase [Limnobacter thiooxidans]|uniref:2-hydroxychromene-2-carboxylate isomerase n=1 Tax=Limnobacter thiooxidans TaxID=131080 RepID=A0AA86J0Y5_9BURK|nr:2-hydroxychromene-2-carboxylate isomerase [Limnobacter thiooxidans]BET24654.1 2-hydroxychromene-2-carboxylate isomerase [Limnobacter thiooxidans]